MSRDYVENIMLPMLVAQCDFVKGRHIEIVKSFDEARLSLAATPDVAQEYLQDRHAKTYANGIWDEHRMIDLATFPARIHYHHNAGNYRRPHHHRHIGDRRSIRHLPYAGEARVPRGSGRGWLGIEIHILFCCARTLVHSKLQQQCGRAR